MQNREKFSTQFRIWKRATFPFGLLWLADNDDDYTLKCWRYSKFIDFKSIQPNVHWFYNRWARAKIRICVSFRRDKSLSMNSLHTFGPPIHKTSNLECETDGKSQEHDSPNLEMHLCPVVIHMQRLLLMVEVSNRSFIRCAMGYSQ